MSKNYNCYHVLDQIFLPWGPTSRTTTSPFVSLRFPSSLVLADRRARHPAALHLRRWLGRASGWGRSSGSHHGGLQRAHPWHQVRPRALLEDTNIQDGAVAGPWYSGERGVGARIDGNKVETQEEGQRYCRRGQTRRREHLEVPARKMIFLR